MSMSPEELDQLSRLACVYAEEKRFSDRALFNAAYLVGSFAAQDHRHAVSRHAKSAHRSTETSKE